MGKTKVQKIGFLVGIIAMLVIGCQGFVGIPICNFFVRKYCNGILAGKIQMGEKITVKEDTKKKKLFDFGWMAGDNTIMCAVRTVDDTIILMDKLKKIIEGK